MKVPVYNTQVNIDTPNVPTPPNPGAVRGAFGEQVYAAGANLGRTGSDIAGALQKHAEVQRKIQTDAAIAQADTNYRLAMQDRVLSGDQEDYDVNGQKYQRPVGLLNRQLDAATGSTEEFDKWHNEQLNSVLQDFPDQQSKDRLVNSLNNHYFTMRDNVIGHEAKQKSAGNISRLEGNIGQKLRDSVIAQDPISLSLALDEVGITQEELNHASGFDRATSDLNIAKTTGKLAETSVLSALDTDPTGAKSTLLLDSIKGKLDPAAYKEISDNVKKSSKKLLEDAKYNAKQAKFINEAKILFDFADGKLGNMNVSQLNDLANSGKVRNEFATAAIRAIQRPINAYEDDDLTFIERANGIFSSKNPEQTNAALLDVLDGFSAGNLGQDKMTLLIQSAKKIGETKAPIFRDNFKRIYDWGTEAGLRVDYKSDMTQDYLKGIAAGNDPAQAADVAIQNAIQKQGVGSKKEQDLNNDVLSSFEYISKDGRDDKIVGLRDLDSGLYQYLLKSGLSPDDASKKSYEIISGAGNVDTPFEFIKGVTDQMDRHVPGWRATSSTVKDYLLKKERELNPTRTFNIVKEGVKMSFEQLRQHPFKTPLEAGARYPKAAMRFLEQIQLGEKIDPTKTGHGVFAPEQADQRGAVEIAQDIGSRIIPEPVIKDPNSRFEYYGKVAEQFMYYLPFSTAGVLTEFGLDPAIKLSFDSLGGVLKIPAVAKIMGKEFVGPAWFDDMVKTAVNRFHSPFAKTAEEVKIIREKQINELTDIINDKMVDKMPEIKKAYEKSYGAEPTPEDIKGLIKKKLIDEGVYDKPIKDVAKAINKVKKSGIKFTDVAEVKQGQPGSLVMDKATGKPLEIDATEAAKAKEIKMLQFKTSRAAAVEAGDNKVVKKIDNLIAKNIIVPTPEEMLANRKVGLTQQAIAFAKEHGETKEAAIQALERAAKETQARVDDIKKIPENERTDEQDVQAYTLGQVKQFYREATESLKGELDLARSTSAMDNATTGKVSEKLLQKMTHEELTKYIGERKAGGASSEELNKLSTTLKEKTAGKKLEGNTSNKKNWIVNVENANANAQKMFGKDFPQLNEAQKQKVLTIVKKQQDIRSVKNEKGKGQEGQKVLNPKKGLSSEAGSVILPGVEAAGEAIGKVLESSNLEGLYQKSINRFQSIENTVDKARALGADIKPGEDAGLSATRYLSIANQADAALRAGPFKITKEGKVEVLGEGLEPVLKDYEKLTPEKDASARRQDLNDYLKAKRTIEDLQRPRNEFSDENIVSPEQVAAAQKNLDKLTNKYGAGLNLFDETANRFYEFQKKMLHTLVDNGLMSQEMYDNVLAKNQHYIPFDRVLPAETPAGAMPAAKSPFSGVKSPVKGIKGSELEIHDVIDSVIKNTYKIMDRASRNKVFMDIYGLVKYPELGLNVVSPDMHGIKLSPAETGGIEQTIFRPSPFKPKGNVVEGYIDGKRKYLEVTENMYKAMTGMDEVSSGIIIKMLSQPASWLRTGATITPEFILRNPIRDQWTALIQTHVGFRPFIDSAGAVADILGKSPVYNEWIRSGGSYASFVELSRPQLRKIYNEIMGNPGILTKLNVVNTLQGISQVMEQATRLGVYKAGLRSGLSPVEASKQARESTLDFARRGTATKEINSVIAFFNAGLQSLDKTVRLAKEDPGGMTMKALAAITIPSLLLYLKNRNDPDYKELPRWQKDLFWMTKIGDNWIRIPKPFLYGQVFGSIPERFFEYVESKDPGAFSKLNDSLYNSLSPVAGDPVSGLLPTGVKPLVENQTNWSFFRDRPLVPESKQRLIPSEQTSDNDTETSKVLGKIFNVSPSKIENLVSGYFGGSGRYVMQGGELLLNEVKKLRGEEVKKKLLAPSDIPVVKGFVARDPIGGQAESVQKFYDTKNDVNKLHATYRAYLKNGDNQKANDFLAKYPELKYSKEFDSISKQLTKISEQIDMVTQSDTMQEAEKRTEIERLNRMKVDLAITANQRFKAGK